MKKQWKAVQILGYVIGAVGSLIILLSVALKVWFIAVIGSVLLLFALFIAIPSKRMAKQAVDVIPLRSGEMGFSGIVIKSTSSDIPLQVNAQVSLYDGVISLSIGTQVFNILATQVQGAAMYGTRTNAAGAVITGITGVDAKQHTTQHFYTYITYKSASGESAKIDFEVFSHLEAVRKFNDSISPKQVISKSL